MVKAWLCAARSRECSDVRFRPDFEEDRKKSPPELSLRRESSHRMGYREDAAVFIRLLFLLGVLSRASSLPCLCLFS